MKGVNKAVFALLVVVVSVAAVLAGFGMHLFSQPPTVNLPPLESGGTGEPVPGGPGEGSYVRVEVTPDTVQSVIATLSRPQSYARSVTVESWWDEGADPSVTTAQVRVDGGWTAAETTLPDGRVQHSVIGGGVLYRWYAGDRSWYAGPAERETADLAHRVPTYEDVLAAPRSLITETGYEEKNGLACVYVEVRQDELGYRERYWVAVSTGLLVAAETWKDERIIYRMSSSETEVPVAPGTGFSLPDGTVLHSAGAAD